MGGSKFPPLSFSHRASSASHLCGPFLPATPSLIVPALRATRKTSLLRGECTGDMRYVVNLRGFVTSPRGELWFRVEGGVRRHISSRRGRGNVGIPKGFPKSVEGWEAGSLSGFPCFPYFVISHVACVHAQTLEKRISHQPVQCACFRDRIPIDTHRLLINALTIWDRLSGRERGSTVTKKSLNEREQKS